MDKAVRKINNLPELRSTMTIYLMEVISQGSLSRSLNFELAISNF
jgi:hypothetical protein